MRMLIVDQDPDYRAKLRYHLEVEWPDSLIDDFDPKLRGAIPPNFDADQYDLIMLADPLLDEQRLESLHRLKQRLACPPIIVFATEGDELLAVEAMRAGAHYYFPKDQLRHQHLVEVLKDCLPDKIVDEDLGDPFAKGQEKKNSGPSRLTATACWGVGGCLLG